MLFRSSSGNHVFEHAVSLLAAENVVGTATGFVVTANYYENISESFRSELDDLIVVHSYKSAKVDPPFRPSEEAVLKFKMCNQDLNELPLVIKSPGGIKGLHLSPPTFLKFKGLTNKESESIYKVITNSLFSNDYIYDYWYKQNGDILIFDNSITLHRRVGQTDNRKIYRIEHTYDNILSDFYEPYLQNNFAKKHRQLVKEIIKLEKKSGFQKPPFYLRDLL